MFQDLAVSKLAKIFPWICVMQFHENDAFCLTEVGLHLLLREVSLVCIVYGQENDGLK